MKNKLIEIIITKSLQIADTPIFELASKKKSNLYIDCKKTTCNALGKVLIGNLIFDKISNLQVNAIGGLTLGADPIANAVSYTSAIRERPIDTFIVRKTPKEHGLKKNIEGDIKKGDTVVIVDDVITTGASTIEAIQKAMDFGLRIVKVIVLIDRQEGGQENILKAGFNFEAIITKQELLDAYYKRSNRRWTLSKESYNVNRELQNSF